MSYKTEQVSETQIIQAIEMLSLVTMEKDGHCIH